MRVREWERDVVRERERERERERGRERERYASNTGAMGACICSLPTMF